MKSDLSTDLTPSKRADRVSSTSGYDVYGKLVDMMKGVHTLVTREGGFPLIEQTDQDILCPSP